MAVDVSLSCLKCDLLVSDQEGVYDHGCPRCGGKEWAWVNTPMKAYALSENDRRLLRSLRIAPEV